MGNLSAVQAAGSASTVKAANCITVVDAAGGGRVVKVEVEDSSSSMKVGELLLEFAPGHFVAHYPRSCSGPFYPEAHSATATSSGPGPRVSALGADADAMAGGGHVYVLLPMPRLHTRLSPHDHLTIATLLHNHTATSSNVPRQLQAPEDNISAKSAPGLRPLSRRSLAKRVLTLKWGRLGAARVAPQDEYIKQETISSMSTMKAEEGAAGAKIINKIADQEDKETYTLKVQGDQQLDTQLMPKAVMMKAKPWAPKLETISESGQDECC